VRTRDLAAEMRQAVADRTPEDAKMLVALGVSPWLVDLWQMVGVATVRTSRNEPLYNPDPDGQLVLITPALGHYPDTPETPNSDLFCRAGELIDLIAWHPKRPDRWALRTGAAAWLGCIEPQYLNPTRVQVWRSPLNWLRADCEGLCILDHNEAYRILSLCRGGITAEDPGLAAQITDILTRPWPAPTVNFRSQWERA
jgi:hypothetical protein